MLYGKLLPDSVGLDDRCSLLLGERIAEYWVPAQVPARLLADEIKARIGRVTSKGITVRALKLDLQDR